MDTESNSLPATDDEAIVARIRELGAVTELSRPAPDFGERVLGTIALRAFRVQAGIALVAAALTTAALVAVWRHASSQLAETVISAYGRAEGVEP